MRLVVVTLVVAVTLAVVAGLLNCQPGWDSTLCGWPRTWYDTSPTGQGWEWPGGFALYFFIESVVVIWVPTLVAAVIVRSVGRRLRHGR
jgi:hypothetical protein